MRRGRTSAIVRRMIPALLLLTILATGCAVNRTLPAIPVKPILTVEPLPDGGIRLDRDNTLLLLDYIWRLEEGYRL